MKAILITRFGLKPDNITVMMDKPETAHEEEHPGPTYQDDPIRGLTGSCLCSDRTGHPKHWRSYDPPASTMFQMSPDQYPQPLKPDQGILLSASEANELSYEDVDDQGKPIHQDCRRDYCQERESPAHEQGDCGTLGGRDNAAQHPCLFCSLENADAPFLGKPAAAADY